MTIILLAFIIIFSVVLIKSADLTVISIKKIAGGTGLIALSAIVIAIGTSFPELFVGITSAIEGEPGLSLGVTLGSNIANIALIGAGAALIAGGVSISEAIIKRLIWVSFACGVLPYILLIDGNLSRIDGFVMVLVYFSYILNFFKGYHHQALGERTNNVSLTKIVRRVEHFAEDKWKSLARIFIGVSLMLFSADTIVKLSNLLADKMGIPIFIIGLFVLAVGTSLPEFAFSLESLKDKEPQMFIGNLMGSVVANATLIIGLSVIISPINSLNSSKYIFPGIVFISVLLLFYLFIRTKRRLVRWEAGVLLIIYFLFVLIELL